MNDLAAQEMAQLGLKHIEDAVVALLSRHAGGLAAADIATKLGLDAGVAAAVTAQLVRSGRILRPGTAAVYVDNPDKI